MVAALMLTAVGLRAQVFTEPTTGFGKTQDDVGIGIDSSPNAKLHVFSSTKDNVLALYGRTNNNYSTAVAGLFTDTMATEGYCCGLIENLQGNSLIRVSNLQLGGLGTPVIESWGGVPLQLNSVGVWGFAPGDVVVGYDGFANGFRVRSNGSSSFVGSVGVGTTAPTLKFEVYSAMTNADSHETIGLYDTSAMALGVGGGIAFGGQYGSGTFSREFASIKGIKENGGAGDYAGALAFNTRTNGGNPTERMRIDSTGQVGIGTTPSALLTVGASGGSGTKLVVNGDTVVNGAITGVRVINAVYQDVAEWVPASEAVDAGSVVVLDSERSNMVKASRSPYDTSVAGVVSKNPGIVLGEPAATKAQIATTGRVMVHVDASRGAIKIGDLLVTSDKRGRAMKSEPIDVDGIKLHRPGTVIGKALEPLKSGEGEILVLLSLQ
jgi:hypothetical protein